MIESANLSMRTCIDPLVSSFTSKSGSCNTCLLAATESGLGGVPPFGGIGVDARKLRFDCGSDSQLAARVDYFFSTARTRSLPQAILMTG